MVLLTRRTNKIFFRGVRTESWFIGATVLQGPSTWWPVLIRSSETQSTWSRLYGVAKRRGSKVCLKRGRAFATGWPEADTSSYFFTGSRKTNSIYTGQKNENRLEFISKYIICGCLQGPKVCGLHADSSVPKWGQTTRLPPQSFRGLGRNNVLSSQLDEQF